LTVCLSQTEAINSYLVSNKATYAGSRSAISISKTSSRTVLIIVRRMLMTTRTFTLFLAVY